MALRKLLHMYFLSTRSLTIGVRAAVKMEDGKVLLVRHTYWPGWHFPGGGLEKGETALDALVREVQQETGISVVPNPKLHGIFFNRDVSARDHVLVYICRSYDRLPVKPPSLEIAEQGLFEVNNLPASTDPGTRRRIQEILGAKNTSLEW